MADVLKLNADGLPMSLSPLSVIDWTEAIRLVFTDKAKVLKSYDDWVVRSQHLEMNVPSIIIMSDQAKWNKSIRYSRTNIFLRDDFTCQLQITSKCKDKGGKFHADELTLDHVVPKSHGGKTTWTNIVTCCKSCNSSKGNDHTIIPKTMPKKPSYYELLSKRKTLPIHVKDEEWKHYIQWPDHLIHVVPHMKGHRPNMHLGDE